MISYEGITESKLILGLYKGSSPLGYGHIHHTGDLTEDDVKADLVENDINPHFDYYRGHPFKLTLNTKDKTFENRLFDRDAGRGKAQWIVDQLKAGNEP